MLKGIFSTAITWSGSTLKEASALGHVWVAPDGRSYRLVRNDHTAALSLGDVVARRRTDTDKAGVFRNGTTNTLASLLGGVVTSTSGIGIGEYGWVQISGYCPTVNVEGTTDIAAGNVLVPASNQLYAVQFGSGTTAPTGAYLLALAAFATDATGQIACEIFGQ